MIYVSTGYSKKNTIDTIEKLVSHGVNNIELSGGVYKKNIFQIIKKKYPETNFLFHNYFPPAKKGFVLNLASTNDQIYKKTIKFYINSIKLCKKYNIKKYGIHAGFFNDINVSELNRRVKKKVVINRDLSFLKLKEGFIRLKKVSEGKVELYLENNVITQKNLKSFENQNPFIFTCYNDFMELRKIFKFKPLLDVGHLKVSCKTLNLNFSQQFNLLSKQTNYFHISNNGCIKDDNFGYEKDIKFQKLLKKFIKKKNTVTLEIYDKIEVIRNNLYLTQKLINNNTV